MLVVFGEKVVFLRKCVTIEIMPLKTACRFIEQRWRLTT